MRELILDIVFGILVAFLFIWLGAPVWAAVVSAAILDRLSDIRNLLT